jgi:segregation and condensation protein A
MELVRAPHEGFSTKEKFQVVLPAWAGPYDLLLQVIDEQNLNLLDLDISILLAHYLDYIEKTLEIDVDEAGEFLVVGATLAQIKSKLLLPQDPSEQEVEEKDPREDLVRYLQEYQKIKVAAELLKDRPLLGRDVFTKGIREAFEGAESEGRGTLFQLVKGFQSALKDLRAITPMEVSTEQYSVSDRMREVVEQIEREREVSFEDLLKATASKLFVIASFLSVLELVRLKQISLFQGQGEEARLYLRWRGNGDTQALVSEFDSEFKEEGGDHISEPVTSIAAEERVS